jgi:flagellum-specific peptidoglycan hydrolase FlgJ
MNCNNCEEKEVTLQVVLAAFDELSAYADELQRKNKVVNSRIIAQRIYEVLYGSDDD